LLKNFTFLNALKSVDTSVSLS